MTGERPADVAALTELTAAISDAFYAARMTNAADDAPSAEGLLAARVAAAYAEGHEAGRAEVTAAVEALADEWADPKWPYDLSAASAYADDLRAALAGAPTLATVRADAGRDGAP